MERPTIPINRKDILVVEDNEEVREVLSRSLEVEGYIVWRAPDGQAALDLLQKASPDLIISDIQMPRLNGYDFYKAVRSVMRWTTIPFIFVTASDSPEEIRAGRMLGVEDYLTKPVDHYELVKTVNARLLRSAEIEIAHIHKSYLETVKLLASSIEGRDPFTYEHVERVAAYAHSLAAALGWPEEHLRTLEFGARLHDIGKIIIDDAVLKKPGRLTAREWSRMKQHPEVGARMIREISHLRTTLPYILYHHERWDGSGYPFGLAGREIPLEGRLMAIVDVYDALRTKRSYHPPQSHATVIRYLRLKKGSEFDPDLVEIFAAVLEKPLAAARREQQAR